MTRLARIVWFLLLAGCSLQRSGTQPAEGVDARVPDADVGDGGVPDDAVVPPDTGRPDTGPPPDGCVPSTETCDGADEDCDRLIDEGVTRACATACGAGVETCAAGVFGACDAPAPTAEACDGVDDDCDGMIDEGLTQACSTACGSGVETCVDGAFGGCTAPAPAAETCNGVDDDCDGMTDELLTRSCTSACGSGMETCSAGSWGGCTAPAPAAETCNGMDDDCDGLVDEPPADCGCTRGTRMGSTYLFCDRQAVWTTARDFCAMQGYALVTLETDAEALAVANTALMLADADWWIGLNDRAVEDTFVWVSGSGAGFRRWSSGQPNDFGGQDCVTIDNGGAFEDRTFWGDKDCGETNRFICETP
ncbi:MAG: C-type lectin domain-containing protein [Myxococcota bacterium]|nr:C-type lectin domain-containing protein [Myxococcota bacterium]